MGCPKGKSKTAQYAGTVPPCFPFRTHPFVLETTPTSGLPEASVEPYRCTANTVYAKLQWQPSRTRIGYRVVDVDVDVVVVVVVVAMKCDAFVISDGEGRSSLVESDLPFFTFLHTVRVFLSENFEFFTSRFWL